MSNNNERTKNDTDSELELAAVIAHEPEDGGDHGSESDMNIPELQRDLERAEAQFELTTVNESDSSPTTPTRPTASTSTKTKQSVSYASSEASSLSMGPWSSTIKSSQSTAPIGNVKERKLRHQATSIAGATRSDAYDDDLLHRAVADAGRWAYGTIFVEVWLLTDDRCALVRPNGGWWIDPVHHHEYHGIHNEKDKTKKQNPVLPQGGRTRVSSVAESLASYTVGQPHHHPSCPVCRLTDPNRTDYIEPGYHVPGEGLPGILWAGDHNAHYVNDRSVLGDSRRSLSVRGLSRRGGGGGSRGGSRRGSTKQGAGAKDGSSQIFSANGSFLFPRIQQKYQGDEGAEEENSIKGTAHGASAPPPTTSSKRPRRIAKRGRSAPVATENSHHRRRDRGNEEKPIQVNDFIAASTMPTTREGSQGHLHGDHHHHHHHHPEVVWRDINSLATDPDQPYNPRLQHMAQNMTVGWAAAVPIRHNGEKLGIVIYMCRAGVDLEKVKNPTNEAYLVAASNLISAALILRSPRHEAVKDRLKEFSECMHRIRLRILEARAVGIPLDELVRANYAKKLEEEENEKEEVAPEFEDYTTCLSYHLSRFTQFVVRWFRLFSAKLTTILKKCRGAQVRPPPSFSWRQSVHTFFGVLISLLILTNLNTRLQQSHGMEAALVLGPFGALMTLIYGLTAAPASQPRNALLGQTLSVGLALILQAIPRGVFWTLETRQSVTTALAVALMVKTGLTHPPAGAAALIFSSSDTDSWEWSHLGVLLMGNAIAIGVGAFINNISDTRQYPTFWGVRVFTDRIERLLHRKKNV